MPPAPRLRHRRRMKRKEAEPVLAAMVADFGLSGVDPEAPIDVAEIDHQAVYLLDNEIIGLEVNGHPAPALRGLLRWPATKRWVTVDMGAIKFVTNGADVMAPGITDADPDVKEGEAVWIRDETHGRPLAIGIAQQSGPELKTGNKGKVIQNLHTVGDPMWDVGHED